MNAKYVIIEIGGCEMPIVFAPEIEHRSMASFGRIISAGWCEPRTNWTAFGISQGLGLACRAERDTALLRMYFGKAAEAGQPPRPDVDVPLHVSSAAPQAGGSD